MIDDSPVINVRITPGTRLSPAEAMDIVNSYGGEFWLERLIELGFNEGVEVETDEIYRIFAYNQSTTGDNWFVHFDGYKDTP